MGGALAGRRDAGDAGGGGRRRREGGRGRDAGAAGGRGDRGGAGGGGGARGGGRGGSATSGDVGAGNASWITGIGWGPRDFETSRVDIALYRLRKRGGEQPFSAEQLAALRAVRPVYVPSSANGGLTTQLREAAGAWGREGNPRRREAL